MLTRFDSIRLLTWMRFDKVTLIRFDGGVDAIRYPYVYDAYVVGGRVGMDDTHLTRSH